MTMLHDALSGCPNIHQQPLLQACIKETGRRYSGVNMLRLARQPVKVKDNQGSEISVPTGSVVSISPYLTHHDPAVFKDPGVWDPERWLRKGEIPEPVNTSKAVSFLQFGAGSHRCPGENMAGIIAREMIANLIKDYTVEWGSNAPPDDTSFSTSLDFTKIGSPWLKGDASVRIIKRV
jgi:sterol 14alpha-demethylase